MNTPAANGSSVSVKCSVSASRSPMIVPSTAVSDTPTLYRTAFVLLTPA